MDPGVNMEDKEDFRNVPSTSQVQLSPTHDNQSTGDATSANTHNEIAVAMDANGLTSTKTESKVEKNKLFQYDQCCYKSRWRGTHIMTVHSDERPFMCEICGNKKYKSKYSLQSHIRERHSRTEDDTSKKRLFQYDQCDYKTKRKHNLKDHVMGVHTDEDPFLCEICGKKYKHKYNFRNHIREHSNEKLYVCRICNHKCSQKRRLQSHMQLHKEPFKCNICDFKCFRRSGLRNHTMAVHTGEKPYKCKLCIYKGALKHSVKLHFIRIHIRKNRGEGNTCD